MNGADHHMKGGTADLNLQGIDLKTVDQLIELIKT
jgi:hypothetical protein